MYAFITGKVAYQEEGMIVIENQGIGYNLFVSNQTLSRLEGATGEVCLYTHLHVKEDEMSLYGFYTKDEKTMFLKLIGISGVGCKVALQILSGLDFASLAVSIATGDVAALSKIKGIGKKTAERIILELREKIVKSDLPLPQSIDVQASDPMAAEAVLALMSLGMSEGEAMRRVADVRQYADKTEQIITLALRSIDR